ncbi:GNAT family N-acetyltransferase [Arthrobacter sp. I3]|uniref:GNAT family N-acetyltransferase n=1 Tax=Arthrobacter sp. I3 TaxID=218158 RepID=UPI0004AD33FD
MDGDFASVYVGADARGLGLGGALLRALAESTESDGIWTIQASVFPENEASLKLHLANGYTVVGRRRRIARMTYGPLNGHWRDTVLIERRSPAI